MKRHERVNLEQRGEDVNGESKGFTVGDIWVRK